MRGDCDLVHVWHRVHAWRPSAILVLVHPACPTAPWNDRSAIPPSLLDYQLLLSLPLRNGHLDPPQVLTGCLLLVANCGTSNELDR